MVGIEGLGITPQEFRIEGLGFRLWGLGVRV